MRISDWSSDVCSSDLIGPGLERLLAPVAIDATNVDRAEFGQHRQHRIERVRRGIVRVDQQRDVSGLGVIRHMGSLSVRIGDRHHLIIAFARGQHRSEEHTSELQSLMRISYAVFCLKQKNEYTIFLYYISIAATTY